MTARQAALPVLFAILGLAHGYDTTFCADKATGLYADPKDCTKYYNCYSGVTYSIPCPPTLRFNPIYSVCDWPANVLCEEVVTPAPETPEQQSTLRTTQSPAVGTSGSGYVSPTSPQAAKTTAKDVGVVRPSPIFCRERADGLYADPADCNGFYQCHRGYTYRLSCGSGLQFNQDRQYCDWEYNVKCVSVKNADPVRGQGTTTSSNLPQTNPTASNLPTTSRVPQSTQRNPNSSEPSTGQGCGRVVCYFPNWASYRFGGASFNVRDIDPFLCTHIIYAFATLRGNRLVALESRDEPYGDDIGNYARVTNLKNINPRLKVLLAVGGWSMGTAAFTLMASTEQSRQEFLNSTIEFLRKRNFDGLDFDWEYPAIGSSPPQDRGLHALLCQQLRAAFDAEAVGEKRLLLTAAVAAGKGIIDVAYDVPRLSAAVDFFNVMAYDLHGAWDRRTGHHSPLSRGSWETGAEEYLNVEWVANYWVSLGAPKSKLVIGMPLYGRSFTLEKDTPFIGVGAPILGAGQPGPYTSEAGILAYYEVCVLRAGADQVYIESQNVPYLVKNDQWVGYEDQVSLRAKVTFTKQNGFGGVMVWDMSHDDFNGEFCGEGNYPLVKAINNACAV
ncbi:chitotriosidase-1-like [Physella acuta]|uniref:chitotriosidase-1-like n=1 Tax=Physella acuta TaxID=109671 RepID=UPI0027DBB38C|nr:chitotriosidase-1-like [Physella acuta]